MAIFAAIVTVSPSASADHWDGANNPDPGNPHQTMPTAAVAEPDQPCVVTGEVSPGAAGGTAHQPPVVGAPDIPGYNASHSHYNFIQTLIACLDFPTGTGVTANGGNDGHLVDPEDPTSSLNHAGNDHHGSTNESGWSHCSDYSGDADNSCNDATKGFVTDTESNVCNDTDDLGKGDIELPALGDKGWVKYIRIGVAIYAWGCFDQPVSQAITNFPHFSAVLAIFPPAVLTGGVVGNPAFPLCLVPEIPVVNPAPGSCGFSLVGVAWRGSGWAA